MTIQQTSRDAYASINASTTRQRVYDAIATFETITAEDIQAVLDMAGNTVRPRIRELVEAKRVEASGTFGATKSGRKAIKWKVAS